MSKSRGNVVDPAGQVSVYGADVLRTFMMFIGPWARGGPWASQGIKGVERFYRKLWSLVVRPAPGGAAAAADGQVAELRRKTHQTIARVGRGVERFEFNTAVAALMEFVNFATKVKETLRVDPALWAETMKNLVLLLAPFGPHIAEELWAFLGRPYSVHRQSWPRYDAELAAEEVFTLVINVNGKVRDRVEAPISITEEEARSLALGSEKVRAFTEGARPKRIVYVPKRLINIVI